MALITPDQGPGHAGLPARAAVTYLVNSFYHLLSKRVGDIMSM